jgi:hypothetical protein
MAKRTPGRQAEALAPLTAEHRQQVQRILQRCKQDQDMFGERSQWRATLTEIERVTGRPIGSTLLRQCVVEMLGVPPLSLFRDLYN